MRLFGKAPREHVILARPPQGGWFRPGRWVMADGKIGIWVRGTTVENRASDGSVLREPGGEVHFVNEEDGTTYAVAMVPLHSVRQAKKSEIPACRRADDATLTRLGYTED